MDSMNNKQESENVEESSMEMNVLIIKKKKEN